MRNSTPGKSLAAPAPAHESTHESTTSDRSEAPPLPVHTRRGRRERGRCRFQRAARSRRRADAAAAAATDEANAEYRATEHVRDYYRTARI